jgi:hypothetical protein
MREIVCILRNWLELFTRLHGAHGLQNRGQKGKGCRDVVTLHKLMPRGGVELLPSNLGNDLMA